MLEVSRRLDLRPDLLLEWVAEGALLARPAAQGSFEIAALSLVHCLLRRGIAVPGELEANPRLLVIDDEPAMLRSTARVLKRQAPHLRVSLAEGAAHGLREISMLDPDVVLVDVHMPELNGIDLCRELRREPRYADLLLIAFSGRRDAELEHDLASVGVRAVLNKPPDVQQLLRLLEMESAGAEYPAGATA